MSFNFFEYVKNGCKFSFVYTFYTLTGSISVASKKLCGSYWYHLLRKLYTKQPIDNNNKIIIIQVL